jgi:hypothetical protein
VTNRDGARDVGLLRCCRRWAGMQSRLWFGEVVNDGMNVRCWICRSHEVRLSQNECNEGGMEFGEQDLEGDGRLMKRPEMGAQVTWRNKWRWLENVRIE